MENGYSKQMLSLLGPERKVGEPITQRHMDIAASVQAIYEEAFFSILKHLQEVTSEKNICISGGCAMNSVANGKIFHRTNFKDVFIHPAAGDAGGAVGSAFYLYNTILKQKRVDKMKNVFLGPSYSSRDVEEAISVSRELQNGYKIERFDLVRTINEDELLDKTVDFIANGKVVGWFQGRMEWGPRALGNRSILVDPRKEEMKDILNDRIKRREAFRPFAPAILREAVSDFFENDKEVPYMLMVFKIKPEKRQIIPAVTHVDGTGRLQTVTEDDNRLFYGLLKKFEEKTGVPVLLNTSFNENEPIVNSPEEAIDCFMRTKMDVLIMGNNIISRK
jgi:carbamoyltransferase